MLFSTLCRSTNNTQLDAIYSWAEKPVIDGLDANPSGILYPAGCQYTNTWASPARVLASNGTIYNPSNPSDGRSAKTNAYGMQRFDGQGIDTGNYALQSQTIATTTSFTSPWHEYHSGAAAATCSANQANSPDGTLTATLVNFGSIAGSGQYGVLSTSSGISNGSKPLCFSIWARTVSGTGTLYISLYDGAFATGATTACNLTTTWQQFSVSLANSGYVARYMVIGPNGVSGGGQPTTQSALSVYLWGACFSFTSFVVPYIPTTTAGVTNTPETCKASNPWYGKSLSRYALGAKLTLPSWSWDNSPSSSSRVIADFNFTTGTQNRIGFYIHSDNKLYIEVVDNSNNDRYTYFSVASSPSPMSTHTVVAELVSGTFSIYLDGALVSGANTGSGTGVIVQPQYIYIGCPQAASVAPICGYMSKFVMGRNRTAVLTALNA